MIRKNKRGSTGREVCKPEIGEGLLYQDGQRAGQGRGRVPEGVALLDANQNGDYIRHPREVAHIQDKLPRVEKLEYIRSEKGYHGSDFAKL